MLPYLTRKNKGAGGVVTTTVSDGTGSDTAADPGSDIAKRIMDAFESKSAPDLFNALADAHKHFSSAGADPEKG